jgi:hypothetical protein
MDISVYSLTFKVQSHGFKPLTLNFELIKVRMKGLEPPRLSAPDPKSGAAANYATSAEIFFIKNAAKSGWVSQKECEDK